MIPSIIDKELKELSHQFQTMGMRQFMKLVAIPKPFAFVGAGASQQLCNAVGRSGASSVIIITDTGLVKLGVIAPLEKTLQDAGVKTVVFDGVLPDPTFTMVEQGLELIKQHGCDAILVVGGGSPMDTAKGISVTAGNDTTVDKLMGYFKVKEPGLPLYAIPTTAGTGSEVTMAAVLSDPQTHEKLILADPKVIPIAVALDPSLMTGLPKAITAATGMDALTHAIESYISTVSTSESDHYGRVATRLILENLPECYDNGDNIQAREMMAIASCYAGIAFTRAFLGYAHSIAHNLGAKYHLPHGFLNAIILPYILEFSIADAGPRLAELAVACGLGAKEEDTQALAQKLIDKIKAMNVHMNIPDKIKELKAEDIPELAKGATAEAQGSYPVPTFMSEKECEEILKKMLLE